GGFFCRTGRRSSERNDDIHLEPDEFSHKVRELLEAKCCISAFNDHVLALNPAQRAQFLPEWRSLEVGFRRRIAIPDDAYPWDMVPLPRVDCEWHSDDAEDECDDDPGSTAPHVRLLTSALDRLSSIDAERCASGAGNSRSDAGA